MFMGGKNITEICAVENILESGKDSDPRFRTNVAGNESRGLSANGHFCGVASQNMDSKLTCRSKKEPARWLWVEKGA